jgi:phenylpropionate dioxygenase-like ring-hydroxylating dioxygenase large terminal subunit
MASGAFQLGKWDTGRYHECWYPVALSDEVPTGSIVGRDVLGGRVAIYRDNDEVRVSSAYCRHLGADLTLGDLVDGHLRCPFHNWQYGADGTCTGIPSGDRIPKNANLFAFPVHEDLGLIWLYFGDTPQYAPPAFPGFDSSSIVYRAFQVEMSAPLLCDPWLFASNVFDFQHLRVLHGMNCEALAVRSSDHSRGYRFVEKDGRAGDADLEFTVWGTNSIVSSGWIGGRESGHIAAGTPFTGPDGGSRFFFVLAAASDPNDAGSQAAATSLLDALQAHHTTIVNEDIPVLNSLQFDHRVLVKSDKALIEYLRYADGYRTRSFAELESVAARFRG